MAKTETIEAPSGIGKRLSSLSVTLEGVGPGTLLRTARGAPRGFWARKGRWFAHFGRAATLGATPGDGASRFSQIWRQARAMVDDSRKDLESEVHTPPPRLFGGFSFLDDHRPAGVWAAFPEAFFLLPEFELMGGEDGGILTLRRFLDPGAGPGACREELAADLEGLRDRLLAGVRGTGRGARWIPATRVEADEAAWSRAVDRILGEVEEGKVSKVVLARAQSVDAEEGLDPVDVALNLWEENPGAHVFFFEPLPGQIILGAAPETVVAVSDRGFRATAVAGSIARGRTPEEQKRLARSLLESAKDRHEHRMCVEDMVRRLAPHAEDVRAEEEPHVLTLSSIQHLETVIEGRMNSGETALSVLESLHPTPAVCGFPRDDALKLLREEEPSQRGWYSGPVGWFDPDGNGVFVPALRFAVGRGREWKLFAGAGIVSGSDPSKEWEETRIKFHPVLKALSGAGARRSNGGEDPTEGSDGTAESRPVR